METPILFGFGLFLFCYSQIFLLAANISGRMALGKGFVTRVILLVMTIAFEGIQLVFLFLSIWSMLVISLRVGIWAKLSCGITITTYVLISMGLQRWKPSNYFLKINSNN
ncbi:MAG TPA: hypothetical protein VF817_00665 [Patescibacteria group bacterium]